MFPIRFAIVLGDVVLGAIAKQTPLSLVQVYLWKMLNHPQLLQDVQDVQFSHHPFPTHLIEFLSLSFFLTLEAARLKQAFEYVMVEAKPHSVAILNLRDLADILLTGVLIHRALRGFLFQINNLARTSRIFKWQLVIRLIIHWYLRSVFFGFGLLINEIFFHKHGEESTPLEEIDGYLERGDDKTNDTSSAWQHIENIEANSFNSVNFLVHD